MNNKPKPGINDVLASDPEELPTLSPIVGRGESLEAPVKQNELGPRLPIKRLFGVCLLTVGLIAGVFLALHTISLNKQQTANDASLADKSLRLKSQTIPLTSLGLKTASPLNTATGTLTVNGNVNVTNSLVLDPTPAPADAVAGQLYFDHSHNQLGFYNGSSFIYLQGSSGTQVTNYYTTNVTNNNVTNVTSGSSSSSGPTGTAGDIAMFTASNTLGNSIITENGTTINVGGSTINIGAAATPANVTVGSTNNNSTLALQGGTGGITLLTGDSASGASGSINIASGASSTESAGNVTIDTGSSTITGLGVADFTFEPISDINDFEWYVGNSLTFGQDCTVAHTGSCSMYVTGYGTGGGNDVMVQQNGVPPSGQFTVVPGHKYTFSMWVRAQSSAAPIYGQVYGLTGCAAPTQNDSTTQWTNIVWSCTAAVGQSYGWFQAGFDSPTTETHYFDDVTATDVSASVTTAKLNLGTTNAQEVTIGNATNQLSATSIYGYGITLSAGRGDVNVSGTNDTISSTGTGSFTATGGALTLSGAGGSGSGVIVKPQTDTTTAFQVQTASGATLLNADTTNSVITAGGNVIVNTPSSCNYTNYSNYVNGLTPSAYWKLEDTGTTAADSSGNNDTGTLSNVTTNVTPGPFTCANTHPAMTFNAANSSQITTATTAPAPSAYTQIAMFKTSSASGTLLGYTDMGGNHDRELSINNSGQLFSRIYNTSSGDEIITDPAPVTDGNWHIAVATVSATGMYLYVDGALVVANSSYHTPQSYTGSWLLGGGWGISGAPYTGDMGEVAVLPTALTAQQAASLSAISGFYTSNLAALGIGTTTPAANLDDAGTALFHDINNSTAAFQIENNAGTSLLTADTQNNALIVGNDGTPSVVTIRGGAANGTNAAGANLVFQGSNGTGSANGGDIQFQTAPATQGGVNFDTSNTGEVGHGGGAVGTVNMNIANNPDRLLMVVTSNEVNDVTYAGQALTLYASEVTGADGSVQSYIWYLTNPPSGSNTVSVDQLPGSPFNASIGAAVYYNVSQTNPLGTAAVANGKPASNTTSTLPVNTSSTSQVIFDTISGQTCTPAYGQTMRLNSNQPFAAEACVGDIIANGGVTTVGWQLTANDAYTEIAVPINPSLAGSTPFTIPSGSSPDTMHTSLDITSGGYVGVDTTNPQATLDVNGSAFIHTDSAAAVQIQNTVGNTLFIADTHNMFVTIAKLNVTGDLTVDGHIVSGGTAPTVAAGAAACTSPTLTVSGTDTAGTITVTTGSGCSASGTLATITFAGPFAAAPNVTLTPGGPTALALGAYVDDTSVSTTGFTIGTNTTPANATAYQWNYQVIQ